jgi:hypothetical protein
VLAVLVLAVAGAGGAPAFAQEGQRLSGPHVHRNLAVYFIHAGNATDAVPLTLAEALSRGSVRVTETGLVNELSVENAGDEPVFIQAGDIVKGGRQDRVLVVSLLLPPRSGTIPVSSFCVEPGRWSARAGEDPTRFASASEAMPSRRAMLVMASPPTAETMETAPAPRQHLRVQQEAREQRPGPRGDTASRQHQVWDSVARTQTERAAGLGAPVKAPESATSLQLSLEHAALKEARAPYLAVLEEPGHEAGNVVGYVAAINGRPVSANVYASNGLFRKVWPRQLAAVVTEAIAAASGTAPAAPALSQVEEFLAAAERGKAEARETAARMRQETRVSDTALYTEARSAAGAWVHRSYLAR